MPAIPSSWIPPGGAAAIVVTVLRGDSVAGAMLASTSAGRVWPSRSRVCQARLHRARRPQPGLPRSLRRALSASRHRSLPGSSAGARRRRVGRGQGERPAVGSGTGQGLLEEIGEVVVSLRIGAVM
jgi:hypothetical protein